MNLKRLMRVNDSNPFDLRLEVSVSTKQKQYTADERTHVTLLFYDRTEFRGGKTPDEVIEYLKKTIPAKWKFIKDDDGWYSFRAPLSKDKNIPESYFYARYRS